jgi:putative transposase
MASVPRLICERLLRTLRRECLDFVIPMTENHLRRLLQEWVGHYNTGRPHMFLGPGIPQPPPSLPGLQQEHLRYIPKHLRLVGHPILGDLHHEYSLVRRVV